MQFAQLNKLFNKDAGLKAVAESDHTMEQLLQEERSDPRAEQAIAMFCYQAKKQIGALTAALGGLDIIVFTGGIGEHAAAIRKRICDDLDWLGIQLNNEWNEHNEKVISADSSKVLVNVISANEEIMIAGHVNKCLLQYH